MIIIDDIKNAMDKYDSESFFPYLDEYFKNKEQELLDKEK